MLACYVLHNEISVLIDSGFLSLKMIFPMTKDVRMDRCAALEESSSEGEGTRHLSFIIAMKRHYVFGVDSLRVICYTVR